MGLKNTLAKASVTLILLSCSSSTQKKKEVSHKEEKKEVIKTASSVESKIQKTINIGNGFEILVGEEEDFEKFKTYTLFKLKRNDTEIYLDNSLTEYEFGNKLYPLILPLGNESFEILVEVNDRPTKNYLKLLRVNGNKLQKVDKLPTFITKAKNLDSDEELEFAGFWDFPQVGSDGNGQEITAYNPILFYQFTKNGLKLDSALTMERNIEIYGKFSGYEFKESIEVPTTTFPKHEAEVERVKNKK